MMSDRQTKRLHMHRSSSPALGCDDHSRADHCRSLDGEVDDQLQRGSKGKRRRYFLAAALRREQDASLRRLHSHALRPPEAAQPGQSSKSRLSLPIPIYIPLAGVHEHTGTVFPLRA